MRPTDKDWHPFDPDWLAHLEATHAHAVGLVNAMFSRPCGTIPFRVVLLSGPDPKGDPVRVLAEWPDGGDIKIIMAEAERFADMPPPFGGWVAVEHASRWWCWKDDGTWTYGIRQYVIPPRAEREERHKRFIEESVAETAAKADKYRAKLEARWAEQSARREAKKANPRQKKTSGDDIADRVSSVSELGGLFTVLQSSDGDSNGLGVPFSAEDFSGFTSVPSVNKDDTGEDFDADSALTAAGL